MEAMGVLPFEMRVSMLEGLWDRLGRSFIEEDMKTPEGVTVIQKIVKQIQGMMEKGNSGKNLKKMITDTEILDGAMMEFINKKRFVGLG